MNDLQTRLCDILHLGLAEEARLAEEASPRLDAMVDLAESLEPMPGVVYKWRRLSMDAALENFARHRRMHADCRVDYGAILREIRAPSWQVWNRERVRDASTVGSDDLREPQLYLLAVVRSLLSAIHTAAATADVARIRGLAEIARAVPEVGATVDLEQVVTLAGDAGPFATEGCREWTVFQPLTIPVDELTRRYLR